MSDRDEFGGATWYTVADGDDFHYHPVDAVGAMLDEREADDLVPERVEVVAYRADDTSEDVARIAARLCDALDAEVFDLAGEEHGIDTRRTKETIGNAVAELFARNPGIRVREVGRRWVRPVLDDDGELDWLDWEAES